MKILHTADWHLGKRLYHYELKEDHTFFFDWLVQKVEKENVDVVLLSGDVFDLANPASEVRRQYFEVLVRLSRTGCQTVITGGNHDSPMVLNAPKEILRELNVHVVGQKTTAPKEMLIPVFSKDNKEKMVVAAIPFLRDADLRQMVRGESYEDRLEAIRQGIAHTFQQAAETCQANYPNVPAIAMGHLFAAGASTSDSERDIQVGNQAKFEYQQFPDYFNYIALGHIHKPQQLGENGRIFYSGSPIPLSFSEKKDEKRVLLLEWNGKAFSVENCPVPTSRRLLQINGSLEEIKLKLADLPDEKLPLKSLIEIDMQGETFSPQLVQELEELVTNWRSDHAEIVKHRFSFQKQVKGSHELFDSQQRVSELQPEDVLQQKMDSEGLESEERAFIQEAFNEILQELRQTERV